MDLKRGLILAALYLVGFWIIAGPPAADVGHALLVPIYIAIAFVLTGLILLVGRMFLDLDIMPWGLIAFATVFLSLTLVIPLLWYLPAVGLFIAGTMGD